MLIRVQRYPGVRQVFIASEEISHLAVIAINETGPRYAELGTNADQAKVCGVAYGAVSGAVSGKPFRAVTEGIVSGVAIATDVNAGDRVTCASAGKITPINTVTHTVNLISGLVGGAVTAQASDGALGHTSGILSGLTGIQPVDTARVLGKALASGFVLSGHAIPLLVTLGG